MNERKLYMFFCIYIITQFSVVFVQPVYFSFIGDKCRFLTNDSALEVAVVTLISHFLFFAEPCRRAAESTQPI